MDKSDEIKKIKVELSQHLPLAILNHYSNTIAPIVGKDTEQVMQEVLAIQKKYGKAHLSALEEELLKSTPAKSKN